jgi:hypothetical protein
MERAKEVQGKLSAEHPSFVREMLHSHVVKGFWLVSLYRLAISLSIQISSFLMNLWT